MPPVAATRRQSFLSWVNAAYGEKLRVECEKLVPVGEDSFNEDEVLAKAMSVHRARVFPSGMTFATCASDPITLEEE